MSSRFLIGQRLIVNHEEIAIAIHPPTRTTRNNDESTQWVRHLDGVESWYAVKNLQALPGGQL